MAYDGVDIDFDPLTEEGKTDINTQVEDEYDSLLPTEGETNESIFSRFKARFGRGFRYALNRFNKSFRIRNNDNSMPQYMELEQMNNIAEREERINEAENNLSDRYPEWDPSKSAFLFTIDEYNRVEVRLKSKGAKAYHLFNGGWDNALPKTILDNLGMTADDFRESINGKEELDSRYPENTLSRENGYSYRYTLGKLEITHTKLGGWHKVFNSENEINEKLPKSITDVLGREAVDIADEKTNEILEIDKKLERIDEEQIDTVETREARRTLQDTRDELVNEQEEVEEKLSLKEKIKQIIKRYGLTVTGIALAVGTIIGVIISSLQSGLSAVAKGVGSSLKAIGKKLAAILPGMIGAIASFIFKTAGEVVGFLGKHAWLLIVGVVVLMVSQLKKRLNKK